MEKEPDLMPSFQYNFPLSCSLIQLIARMNIFLIPSEQVTCV